MSQGNPLKDIDWPTVLNDRLGCDQRSICHCVEYDRVRDVFEDAAWHIMATMTTPDRWERLCRRWASKRHGGT